MDVWYDLLVRELTELDRAQELRDDAEQSQSVNPEDVEPTPPWCPTLPSPASAVRPSTDASSPAW